MWRRRLPISSSRARVMAVVYRCAAAYLAAVDCSPFSTAGAAHACAKMCSLRLNATGRRPISVYNAKFAFKCRTKRNPSAWCLIQDGIYNNLIQELTNYNLWFSFKSVNTSHIWLSIYLLPPTCVDNCTYVKCVIKNGHCTAAITSRRISPRGANILKYKIDYWHCCSSA